MRSALAILLGASLLACGGHGEKHHDDSEAAKLTIDESAEPVMRSSQNGPIKVTVTVKPKNPRLGDLMRLELTAEAERGVEVTMPDFGEALGRFLIVRQKAEQEDTDKGTVHKQIYTLQAPMSGRQRIPSLRVEYVDNRKGQDGETRELLTEDFPIEVQPVTPDGEVAAKLAPARGELTPHPRPGWLARNWIFLALGAAALLVLVAFVMWRRQAAERKRISAYEVAIGRLDALEASGMPGPDEADEWYVDLSSVVRRYLEDRFGLRAPELTTEEFLREARRSGALTDAHRGLLSSFLEGCDRVKFAGYHPEEGESRQALDSARSFVIETRVGADEAAASVTGDGEPPREEAA
jgi:hypothetical protein